MTSSLEDFCERELLFLEETAQAFAERYPAEAKHLVPEPGRSVDPHLDRFIEGFALLAGRVRHKLDSDFPELTESLLQVLYPHLGLIIPSMAIAQAHVADTTRSLTRLGSPAESWRVDKDIGLRSAVFGTESYQYRLGYPVEVWPIELTRVSWETSPFDPALRPPAGTVAVLRMHFTCKHGVTWDDLPLEKLRLYLSGERQQMASLYEILFNRCRGVVFQSTDAAKPPVTLSADECLVQVGLDLDEGLLPFPPESFLGYRLLMELLSFPQKFLFADLSGWRHVRGRGFGGELETILFLSQSHPNLERGISAQNFLLGCAPVVNLFPKSVEPIDYHHRQPDYRVVPARRQPEGMEVYRIESVRALDSESSRSRDFLPFFSCAFGQADKPVPYFHTSRRDSVVEDVPGSETYLTLVDPEFHPARPTRSVLDVQAWCTNRDFPFKHQQAGDRLAVTGDLAGEHGWFTLLHKPTPPLRPTLHRGTYWRLLGQNALNHVSLVQGDLSVPAVQELLRLCDFSASSPHPPAQQLASVNQKIIAGIKSIRSNAVLERVKSQGMTGMCRGMELQIEFDEEQYTGTGVFLVASVLERFFALYTAVNSFTKVIVKTAQAEGSMKAWPPRAGTSRLP